MLDAPVDKPYEPLDFDRFSAVQNNFYIQFIEDPLNYFRYDIPSISEALDRHERGEQLNYELKPSIKILQKENSELEKRLTESITQGDKEGRRREAVRERMHDLYDAYLILRDYVDGNEGVEFDFSIHYPPKE